MPCAALCQLADATRLQELKRAEAEEAAAQAEEGRKLDAEEARNEAAMEREARMEAKRAEEDARRLVDEAATCEGEPPTPLAEMGRRETVEAA